MEGNTVRRCDCCGKEVHIEPLYQCYNSIRYWDVYRTPPVNIWLICGHCLYALETTMKAEVAKLREESHAEQSDAKEVNESNVMEGIR